MSNIPAIEQISDCFVKPKYEVKESKQPHYLTQCDLVLLSFHYIQKGLLFAKQIEHDYSIDELLVSLKDSLALALVHFYPLAGQLVTKIDEDHNRSLIFLDCNKGPGARFVHAILDVTVSDIVSSVIAPPIVHSLFDHNNNGEVGYDGHTLPSLSVQVTQLVDGVFIGCSMNHGIVDGTSFWHFWNMWSEIHRAKGESISISRPPVYNRWYPDGYGPSDLYLPSTQPDELISKFNPPRLKEKFFSFGLEAITKLKAEGGESTSDQDHDRAKPSSFQALAAFVWRSIIRAKRLTPEVMTHCKFPANNRYRVKPALPQEYFGNSVHVLGTSTTVGNLLGASLGWVAGLLNQSVRNHTDEVVRSLAQKWFESPFVHQFDSLADTTANSTVVISSSPRFDMYGNEFAGLGKPVAVRSGFGNKFCGSVTAYPGNQGSGSVDFEICLTEDCMSNLESDQEFMSTAILSQI